MLVRKMYYTITTKLIKKNKNDKLQISIGNPEKQYADYAVGTAIL